ncbi:hypothetical protein AAG747_17550 [Rapidithrix thailandica]|uniref:Uncharacterized protein n=1 Tax=Rapidithrix thailandica TaxID=413964 RepID=A0AAW9SB89_9BACT
MDPLHPKKVDHVRLAETILKDNPVLTGKIAKGVPVEEKEVLPVLTEVIKFLNLIAFSDQKLSPSLKVDYAWHEFILCTRYYYNFCEVNFGRMIHHHPGGSQNENHRQYQQTLKLYTTFIGKPPVVYWGEEASQLWEEAQCGLCSGNP